MVPLFEPSKKVVPLFECEKRWCHYLIITLKVVPLYDVYPFLKGTGKKNLELFGEESRRDNLSVIRPLLSVQANESGCDIRSRESELWLPDVAGSVK